MSLDGENDHRIKKEKDELRNQEWAALAINFKLYAYHV